MSEFVGILIFLITAGAVMLLGALTLIARFIPDEEASGVSGVAAADYVNRSTAPPRAFSASHQEVEAETTPEAAPEAPFGVVYISEKALQFRDDDNYERGAVELYAFLAKRGYLPKGKATEIKEGFFRVAGGRRLQALNAAIDAVEVQPPDPAQPAPEPARVVAINDGRGGYVEL